MSGFLEAQRGDVHTSGCGELQVAARAAGGHRLPSSLPGTRDLRLPCGTLLGTSQQPKLRRAIYARRKWTERAFNDLTPLHRRRRQTTDGTDSSISGKHVFLVEIETDRTECAERVSRQCSRKCRVGKIRLVRQVSDIDRQVHSFYPVENRRIEDRI